MMFWISNKLFILINWLNRKINDELDFTYYKSEKCYYNSDYSGFSSDSQLL